MLEIEPIHAFSDNFIWMLRDADHPAVAVVDPGDAGPVLARIERDGLQLGAILITHKHSDHVGGIDRLLAAYPGIPVFGPAGEPIPQLTHRLREGDVIDLSGIDARFEVIEVPGHTEGHIAYYREGILLCGDTLFSAGCGRVFSGTFDQLHDSLMRIAELPGETLCYCAHEYTLDNIGFAKWVEPDSPALLEREQACHDTLDGGGNTVPVALSTERATNPFLRIRQAAVLTAVEAHYQRPMRDSRDTFRSLREWKDREYD